MMKTFKQYITSYKLLLGLLFLFIFVQALSQLYLPALMGDIVDRGVITGNIRYIWQTGMWMLAVATIGIVMSIYVSYFAAKIAMGIGHDLRNSLFKKVSHFTVYDFDELGTATLITRTTNDVNQIQQALVMSLRMFLTAPFMFFGGLMMTISQDFHLTLIIFVMVPFLALAIFFVFKYGHPLFRKVQERLDKLNLIFRENLTGVRVIRSFVKEKVERNRLHAANIDLTSISTKVNRFLAFTMPFMMLLMNITIVLIIWAGAHRINSGDLEIGSLMAFIQYVMLIMFSLMMASMMFVILPRASVSWQRIQEVLQTETFSLTKGSQALTDEKIAVSFERVNFAYPKAPQLALEGIHFQANAGKVTAIIGGTGSGKTTLMQLILRFYETTSGKILLNNVKINQLYVQSIRGKIGYVPQKIQLFSGTIKENLRYGKEDATDEEMIHAAKIAQAHDFIQALPDGYDTIVEQGGTNFSGGQKQRLAIARAIVRRPSIYLFDDSFSALDYQTDRRLRDALKDETKFATVFIVAQRVSTIMDADQIIVLDKGKMVGIGTHQDLLRDNHVYKEIVSSQFREGEIA